MKNKTILKPIDDAAKHQEDMLVTYNAYPQHTTRKNNKKKPQDHNHHLPQILVVTSYPPRECGIATYSQDLIKALNNKFSNSLSLKVCAFESGNTTYLYPKEVKYTLDTSVAAEYETMATTINNDSLVKTVLIQHEFGFYKKQEKAFLHFLQALTKPTIVVFHTVLPHPDEKLKAKVQHIVSFCDSIIVMTHTSANILNKEYDLAKEKIAVIAHGTHLVQHVNKTQLKEKYGLQDRKVLTTFGLLSSGKSIETTLEALPAIIKESPEVVFLIIGKTHPEVMKNEGEQYREKLEQKVKQYALEHHVLFVNNYLALPDLLEYLQLTDIYLFTTNDPNQAVSGTFVYAMSCACPIISTPIPHAKEVLTKDNGIIFDFHNSAQLAESVISLLNNEPLRKKISSNTLQKIVSTAWENSAVAHAMLFQQIGDNHMDIHYNLPTLNLHHLKQMTTDTGIIQFSKINQPDISTGYTLDDNARALVASCMYYKQTKDETQISEIRKYLSFIKICQQPGGNFLNYVDEELHFTKQNYETNLDDSNGRAIWALGYVISMDELLPQELIKKAENLINKTLKHLHTIHSTRTMAFAIKGLYYYYQVKKTDEVLNLIITFANRLEGMYNHESDKNWDWFESYLTYANSTLPEAMLYAWQLTKNPIYRKIALSTFDFLLSKIYNKNGIEVISNRQWLQKGSIAGNFGEQPIDVAYTIMSLDKFYEEFQKEEYRQKMEIAFNWFLGSNRLHQIIYNPCTGGCYDGLEETHVNLNQGAESTVSYLMARLTVEKYKGQNSLAMNSQIISEEYIAAID